MNSTPKPHFAVQRLNTAYVQVPPSPLTSYRARGIPAHVAGSNTLKENTPLRPSQLAMSQHITPSASLKRKFSEREPRLVFDGVVISSAKKPRISSAIGSGNPLQAKQSKAAICTNDSSSESPQVYCHQCNKKRDLMATIHCTAITQYSTGSGKTKERSCTYKYCKQCLKNRYNEDIDAFKYLRHSATGYRCPRCRGICNCPKCRKLKGLEATGILANPKSKGEGHSLKAPKKPKDKDATIVQGSVKSKAKELPMPKWTRVPVHLTDEETDDRIFIREFIFRFGDFLDPVVAKTHLEELESIGGRSKKNDDEDYKSGWVSEMCIKAIFLGLLGVLARDHDSSVAKIIKSATKDLRSGGANLNRIWSVLASLRDDIGSEPSKTKAPLTFPDPICPPFLVGANARSLRSVGTSQSLINVVQSYQMIPVVISLIRSVLETAIIREEIDQGAKDIKDIIRDAKEATRIENERWEKERTIMESAPKDKVQKAENKTKRTIHKEQIADIDNAVKMLSTSFATRFMPLGTDNEGRVYYALSPGVAEREAALEYLEIASSDKLLKRKKKGRVLPSDERREMREWSWFVAVRGEKPSPETESSKFKMDVDNDSDGSDSDDESVVEDVDRWWGFWESEEIVKLADWISIKSGLEDNAETLVGGSRSSSSTAAAASSSKRDASSQPRNEQLKRLVAGLRDYAALLEWRACDDKYMLVRRVSDGLQANDQDQIVSKGKERRSVGTVSVEKF